MAGQAGSGSRHPVRQAVSRRHFAGSPQFRPSTPLGREPMSSEHNKATRFKASDVEDALSSVLVGRMGIVVRTGLVVSLSVRD